MSKLDVKFIARLRKSLPQDGPEEIAPRQEDLRDTIHSTFDVKPWLRIDNDELFESLS